MFALKTIDAHAGGGPLRLVIEGVPAPRGKTMRARTEWMARHADQLRRVLMLEPRGHRDMTGAMLTEPVTAAAHAGLIFMNDTGFPPMSGHGVIAATTIALERGLVVPGGDGRRVTFDTVAGTVTARATTDDTGHRVTHVTLANVPSFVVQASVALRAEGRDVQADVAFGGAFYAVIDAESVGLGVEAAYLPVLRRVGRAVAQALDAALTIVHPLDPHHHVCQGAIFTGPPHADDAHLRCLSVSASGEVGRSPSGTGMSAVMAVLDAMGLLGHHLRAHTFVAEGLLNTRFTGRVADRTVVGDIPAIVPEIEGSAWITGEQTLLVDQTDPLALGVSL